MLPTSIKNKIRDNYATNGKNLELEAKFGHVSGGKFNSGLSRQTYNRVKAYFDKNSKSVYSKTTDYIMGRVRKSVDENNDVKWITKERLWNEDLYDYGIRYSMSREIDSPPILSHFVPELIREKFRSSYLVFNNTIRLDITLVNTIIKNINESSYEVEIELLDEKALDNFEKAVNVTIRLVLDTVVLYTEKEILLVSNEINSILGSNKKGFIDHYPLVQARNLKLRDMVYGGLIGNKKTGYSITHKTDGERRMLYISKTGIWLASSASLTRVTNVSIPTLYGTILDGEMVPVEKRLDKAPKSKFWFLIFDTLAWNSDNSVQNSPHGQRMNYAQTAADAIKGGDLITVNTKSFYNFDTPAEFFALMRNMFRDQLLLPYKQDGFMFTPQNEIYNPHTDKYPLYKRKLTDYPDICKYKDKKDLTIDLQIKWRADISSPIGRTLDLFSIDKNNLILFTKFENVDFTNPLTINLPSNSIVEYGYDYERKMLFPHRVRFDKERPNRKDVAEDVAEDILTPIDKETMEGNSFALLRRYHNFIKKKLFDRSLTFLTETKKIKTLLDIGSGYGGDLRKWKGFDRIVAVEPDPEHMEELQRRILSIGMQDKVRVVLAGGQETDKIKVAVDDWLEGGADVISSMLSLTFFWQNSDLVDSLVRTIVTNIKPGGQYIFLTMDGDLVEQTFEPAFGTGQTLKKLVLGPATLEYNSNVNPKELYINIKGTIVENQKEWLVRLDDLKLRLGKYGFELTDIHKADEEKFLTEEETLMTKMYTYGSFVQKTIVSMVPLTVSKKEVSVENKRDKEDVKGLGETKEVIKVLGELKEEAKVLGEIKIPEILTSPKIINLPPLTPLTLPSLANLPPLKLVEKEEELGMIDVDTLEYVVTTWREDDDVVRIGSVAEGSCLIHSILNGYLKYYQTNPNVKFRKNFAKKLRKEISETLRKPDPKNPRKIYYETAANGSFPELYAEQLLGVDFKDVFGQHLDFSIEGLEKLFNSTFNLGDEIYSFIGDLLDIDIYIMRITNKDLYPHANTHKPGVPKRSVVVAGNGYHYETIGLIREDLIQTFFEPNDLFIIKIQSFSNK